ncbi:MAG: XdhC family protein [Acidobacteriota bacterium]|nr:XdhC family protein [Acidobacteriota bacterium]
MFDRFLQKAEELVARGESFAFAVVVRTEGHSSGKAGDNAIVTVDGQLWGWVGGGCTQPVVIKEALKALADGRARLVRIAPEASPESPAGIVDYTMKCHSGGALDIFIEPVTAKPRILILGRSPVARTLARLAAAVEFSVAVAAPEASRENFPDADVVLDDLGLGDVKIGPQTFIVVSTQGERDEDGVELALSTEASYIAFVASRTKAEKILKSFAAAGATEERLKRVRAPAGMAIGAKSPEEIAVSILAEIIQVKAARAQSAQATQPAPAAQPAQSATLRLGQITLGAEPEKSAETAAGTGQTSAEEAIDPICGMTVKIARAKYFSEYRGNKFYFCCAGCKQAFEQQPEKYASDGPA